MYPNSSSAAKLQIFIAIGVLCCLWLGLVTWGWARWGSVTVDSGREIYVPAALAQGKILYRDVWYPYGPGAPYLNALLFLIFGTHITVAYLAGALAGLTLALALFRSGLYLVALPAAFTPGYIIVVQSYSPWIFNYALPYSYAAVYGSVAAALFLLCAVRAAFHATTCDVFWAAMWAAAALLMKLEYGFACFGTLAVLQIGLVLRQRSWHAALRNLAVTLPALLICAIVIGWMISIRGASFITEQNFMSWPSSYFMQAYGWFWLREQGLELSWPRIRGALIASVVFLTFWTAFRFWLRALFRTISRWRMGLPLTAAAGAIGFWLSHPERLSDDIAALIFPYPMVFIVGLSLPVSAIRFWRHDWRPDDLAILLVTTFALLVGFRILFGMMPFSYAIFYNGPVLLAFCWLLFSIAIPPGLAPDDRRVRTAVFILCTVLCTWVTVQLYPAYRDMRNRRIPLQSEHGTIHLPENMLPAWAEAVDFIRHAKAGGESVMSIPEDTALYFFSGALCPVRVCVFTPGVVAPGDMTDEILAELKQAQVRYIIWSNRKFYEYGVPEFGVDFDVPLGEYIRSNYRPMREFGPSNSPDVWYATLWEKK